ncbi:MAG: PIN domain-containing protein [Candidatus Micrarchaeia archaeon]|jgi:predicted nucleic acid-binding protein
MRITVDTNVIFAAILRDSTARRILQSDNIRFNMPENGVAEIRKYENEIMQKAGYTKEEFESILGLVLENVELVPVETFKARKVEADEIMGNIDIMDSVFVATCLATNSEGIWSFDRHFERQSTIRVFKVDELLEMV